MSYVTIAILVFLVGVALYQTIGVFTSKPVKAILVDYVEEDRFDSTTGTNASSKFPVYSYTYNGVTRRYKSMIGGIQIFKQDERTLYVNKNGQVFEVEAIVSFLAAAVVVFLLAKTIG